MKICIVSVSAPRNTVMVSMYTGFFKENHIKFDMIYRDKFHTDEYTGAENNYRYEAGNKNVLMRAFGQLAFVRFAKKVMKSSDYDFVVVWGETAAAFLSGFLKKKYKGRYCVNVRDLLEGKKRFLRKKLYKAVRFSCFTTVSSPKYIDELPADFKEYYFVHSYNEKIAGETNEILKEKGKQSGGPLNILYIGSIRFYNHLYRFMDAIKNDSRFFLTVCGHGSEPVKIYAEEHGMNNISVIGMFPKEKTGEYLAQADIIYNLYGTESLNLRTALSNKLYYACCLKIPILVYRNTCMFEMSSECGIGFAADDYDQNQLADALFNWYNNIDGPETARKCEDLIGKAKASQEAIYAKLSEILSLK